MTLPATMLAQTLRYAAPADPEAIADSRKITFVLSDSSVGRDGLTLATGGWKLDNYRKNPVVLFGHDAKNVSSVIGRMENIRTVGDKLVGDVDFMPGDINPVAETVYQMTKARFLNAGSVGFRAEDGHPTTDRSRPGGYDITRQELLEYSIVPVPALPTALADARAAGIDVEPIFKWAEQIVAQRAAPAAAPAVVPAVAAAPKKIGKRDMYGVACLAMLLADLGYIEDMAEWEAAYEEDGSPVPQMLLDCMKQVGAALLAMTAEEVAELVADTDETRAFAIQSLAARPVVRKMLMCVLRDAAAGKSVTFTTSGAITHTLRAGRTLSSANEKTLRDAHDTMTRACDMVRSVVDQVGDDEAEEGDETRGAAPAAPVVSLDQRRAAAKVRLLKLK